MDKIKQWWKYSRIVFINVLYAASVVIEQLILYLVGFDWDAFFSHEIALMVALGINVLNVVLRMKTTGAVGGDYKDDEDEGPEFEEPK